jgi:hypothetical protein
MDMQLDCHPKGMIYVNNFWNFITMTTTTTTMMMMMTVYWFEWEKVTGRLEKFAWLYRICIPYKYFCVNERKGVAMGVKDDKNMLNVSLRTWKKEVAFEPYV